MGVGRQKDTQISAHFVSLSPTSHPWFSTFKSFQHPGLWIRVVGSFPLTGMGCSVPSWGPTQKAGSTRTVHWVVLEQCLGRAGTGIDPDRGAKASGIRP